MTQLDMQVHLATVKVNQAADTLKAQAATWQPRPCPRNWGRK
jgi:hypothetical protein